MGPGEGGPWGMRGWVFKGEGEGEEKEKAISSGMEQTHTETCSSGALVPAGQACLQCLLRPFPLDSASEPTAFPSHDSQLVSGVQVPR